MRGVNPVDGVERALPKQSDRGEYFAALPHAQVPAFLATLRRGSIANPTLLAFEVLILTACRTNEVLLATWDEVDFGTATWTIPAVRMKGHETHVVPLSKRAQAILTSMQPQTGDTSFVFPSPRPGKSLSNMVFLMTLRRMELAITAHGFRSSFRDWAAEETHFLSFVVEKALAHTIANKVEAAYRRGDLLKKRRALMDAWATYCDGNNAKHRSKDTDLNLKHPLEGERTHDHA